MLTAEENERLTRVGRETPMGELVRRFWLPFLQVSDVAEPDGPPGGAVGGLRRLRHVKACEQRLAREVAREMLANVPEPAFG